MYLARGTNTEVLLHVCYSSSSRGWNVEMEVFYYSSRIYSPCCTVMFLSIYVVINSIDTVRYRKL